MLEKSALEFADRVESDERVALGPVRQRRAKQRCFRFLRSVQQCIAFGCDAYARHTPVGGIGMSADVAGVDQIRDLAAEDGLADAQFACQITLSALGTRSISCLKRSPQRNGME